ncbi:MAG: divalent-cation tolerance protein CutA, partial [Pseudomonadota bacterium]
PETMPDLILLHIPCPDQATATRIGAALVETRLAACTHVLAPHESRYRWQGNVECETEITLLAKTRAALADRVAEEVRKLHPYDVPAILGTRLDYVNADYAAWVIENTEDTP